MAIPMSPILDRWFDQTADAQYQRELMFSSVFEMMTEVVLSG